MTGTMTGNMTASQPGKANPEEWIELFPNGIAVENSLGRPVLILKDQTGGEVLPVWMSPIDAGIALADMSKTTGITPHIVTGKILEGVGLKAESCTFIDLVGHHQYVQLTFKPLETPANRPPMVIRLRADEAMSFCMSANARFFSTKSYMTRCRAVDSELNSLNTGFADGTLPSLQSEMENGSKKHQYMM